MIRPLNDTTKGTVLFGTMMNIAAESRFRLVDEKERMSLDITTAKVHFHISNKANEKFKAKGIHFS